MLAHRGPAVTHKRLFVLLNSLDPRIWGSEVHTPPRVLETGYFMCTAETFARIGKVSTTRKGFHCATSWLRGVICQNLKSSHDTARFPVVRMALEIARILHFPKVFSHSDANPRKVSTVQLHGCAVGFRQNLKSFHDTAKFPLRHFMADLCFLPILRKVSTTQVSRTRGGDRYTRVVIQRIQEIQGGDFFKARHAWL